MDFVVNIPSLYTFCADSVVDYWEDKNYRAILAEQIKKLPCELVEELVNAFHRKGKLSDVILCQLLPGVKNYLSLQNCSFLRKSAIRKIYFYCEHLRYLDLSGCKQITNTIVHLILQNCDQLYYLNLSSCVNLSDYAFLTDSSPFQALIGLYNLEYINLSNCCQLTGTCIISILKLSIHLRTIVLQGCRSITSDAIEKLLSYPFLSSINISGIPSISDQSLSLLGDNEFQYQLNELNVSNLSVSESVLCSTISKLSMLTTLSMGFYPKLADSLIIKLVTNCPNITHLDINNCGSIGNESIQYILTHLRLVSLDISFCTNISKFAFELSNITCVETLEFLNISWCPHLVDSIEYISSLFINLKQISIKGCGCSLSCIKLISNKGIKVI